jgi:hypothetical protein
MSLPQPKSISGPLSDCLAHYVYLLIDPRDGKVFYVGKGKGGRCFDHSATDDGAAKASKIAEIEAAGLTPQVDIIRLGLENEAEAFLVAQTRGQAVTRAALILKLRGKRGLGISPA